MVRKLVVILAGMLLLTACGMITEEPVSEPMVNSEEETESAENPTDAGAEKEKVKIPQNGGTIYMTMEHQDVYNPLLETNAHAAQIMNLIFSPLIDFDESYKAHPSIASAWAMSEDNRQVTLTIDTSVKWHNGKNVAPGDVVYSIQVLKEAEGSVYKECVANIETANVLDENRVRIQFREPSALNLNQLYFPVISREYYNGSMEEMLGHTTEPMGSGPYRFESYTPMKKMVLTANTEYAGQVPYIDKVEIQLSYSDVRQESFNQKISNLVYLENPNWGDYIGRENIGMHMFSSNEALLLAYNTDTMDIHTRKAIAYALDVEKILADTNLDKGDVTEIPISPSYWYAPTDPSLYRYNQQKVAELLDLSKEIELQFLVNKEDALQLEIADAIQTELQKMGIVVKIVSKNQENFDSLMEKGNYDMALVSRSIVDFEDLKEMPGGTSKSMDKLLEKAETMVEEQQVHQVLAEIALKMSDEMPYYSLFVLKQASFTGKGILGQLTPTVNNVYRGVENLYIHYTEEENGVLE